MKYKIYLAGPFFSCKEIVVYNDIITKLRAMGHDVFVPREHKIPNAWNISNRLWASKVACMDIENIKTSDVVVILDFGMYSDSGTAWEAGYAKALGKKIVHVLCGELYGEYSLMMLSAADIITTPTTLNLEKNTVDLNGICQK